MPSHARQKIPHVRTSGPRRVLSPLVGPLLWNFGNSVRQGLAWSSSGPSFSRRRRRERSRSVNPLLKRAGTLMRFRRLCSAREHASSQSRVLPRSHSPPQRGTGVPQMRRIAKMDDKPPSIRDSGQVTILWITLGTTVITAYYKLCFRNIGAESRRSNILLRHT